MVSARRTLFFVVLVALQSSSLFSETSRASAQDKETQLSPAKGFTIEQALNFPYPEETSIVAAPNADRIAWVENKHGVRNIVVAEAPQWKLQQLTNYTKDDGQTLRVNFGQPAANFASPATFGVISTTVSKSENPTIGAQDKVLTACNNTRDY